MEEIIALTSRPRLSPKARVQLDPVSGKPALLYPEGVLLLNPTAKAILDVCDGSRTLGEAIVGLSVRYGVSVERMETEVVQFLDRLRERGLLIWETT